MFGQPSKQTLSVFKAIAALEMPDWWLDLGEAEQDAYLKAHPRTMLEKTAKPGEKSKHGGSGKPDHGPTGDGGDGGAGDSAEDGNEGEPGTALVPAGRRAGLEHYPAGQSVSTLANLDNDRFWQENRDVVHATPEYGKLTTMSESPTIIDVVDLAEHPGEREVEDTNTPGDIDAEDADDPRLPELSRTMTVALLALAAVGAFFDDSNMSGITTIAHAAADHLLTRAGREPIYGFGGELSTAEKKKKRKEDREDGEAATIFSDDELDEFRRHQQPRPPHAESLQDNRYFRPSYASGQAGQTSTDADHAADFLARYALAYLTAAAQHYEDTAHG